MRMRRLETWRRPLVALVLALAGTGSAAAVPRLTGLAVDNPPRPGVLEGGRTYRFRLTFDGTGFAAPILMSDKPTIINHGGVAKANNATVATADVRVGTVSAPVQVRVSAIWGTVTRTLDVTVSPPIPEAPSLRAPANDAVVPNGAAAFSWTAAQRAGHYEVCVFRQGTTACANDGANGALFSATGTEFPGFVRVARPFLSPFYGQQVLWFVRACNPLGCTNSGQSQRLRVLLRHANLEAPASGTTTSGANVTFRWSAVANAQSYALHLGSQTFNVGVNTQSSLPLPSSLTGQVPWYVAACNSATGCSTSGAGAQSTYLWTLTVPAAAKFSQLLEPAFRHDRCTQCHGFFNGIKSSIPNHGSHSTATNCQTSTCHAQSRVGVAGWRAPAAALDLRQKSRSGLCAMAKTAPPGTDVPHHLKDDALILWAVGSGRMPNDTTKPHAPPGNQNAWRTAVQQWLAAGVDAASCE